MLINWLGCQFKHSGDVAAPPTKEGRGKGAQNKNKRNRSGRGLIIGVVGEGGDGNENLRHKKRRGMKMCVIGEGA